MANDRFLGKGEQQGLAQSDQRQPFDWPFAARSRVFEVFFPSATDVRDVAHGLGEVPDGVYNILVVGGDVRSANVHKWTKDVAYLQASAANTRARLFFVTLREPVINA